MAVSVVLVAQAVRVATPLPPQMASPAVTAAPAVLVVPVVLGEAPSASLMVVPVVRVAMAVLVRPVLLGLLVAWPVPTVVTVASVVWGRTQRPLLQELTVVLRGLVGMVAQRVRPELWAPLGRTSEVSLVARAVVLS